ncbi:pR88 [rat cytomegalovirus strain Maastricht]|uniref:PR88 n=1 Tax=Rat cytomegalovirus (strain Maastricht) TaxID=79700 RepID=Q9DWB4_RCMVM|nr:pR88 [rat cytomegalovirus strain Maastricht]AAF99176.1 pR88 [rat cytomegalovirus strain Maastricht]WEG72009.1 tegument protein UL88 [Murid betaherpesvirus 2]
MATVPAGDSVVIRDPEAVWCDGALVLGDGTVLEHHVYSASLAALVRRKIRAERADDEREDYVGSREISLYVTGRYRRRTSGLSVYWHAHSDVIYILTGVTYCAQIYIEYGAELPGRDGYEVFLEPRVVLVRARDANNGISKVSWSQTPGVWPRDVDIKLVRVPPDAPGARPPVIVCPDVGAVGFPRLPLAGDVLFNSNNNSNKDPAGGASAAGRELWAPVVVGDREVLSAFCSDSRPRLDCDTTLFLERAASVHRRLLVIDRELEGSVGRRREVLQNCLRLASAKRLLLVDGPAVVGLFAAHVCLYGLGEENIAADLVGVVYRRRDHAEPSFRLHNTALANAMQLALALRRLREHQDRLPAVERRLDPGDPMVCAAQDFYTGEIDVKLSVISMAAEVLRAFSARGMVDDAAALLQGRVPLLGSVDRGDLVRVLRL